VIDHGQHADVSLAHHRRRSSDALVSRHHGRVRTHHITSLHRTPLAKPHRTRCRLRRSTGRGLTIAIRERPGRRSTSHGSKLQAERWLNFCVRPLSVSCDRKPFTATYDLELAAPSTAPAQTRRPRRGRG